MIIRKCLLRVYICIYNVCIGRYHIRFGLGVKDGLRRDIPAEYPPTVASIMKACWQHNPSKHPSFLLIASLLTSEFYGAQ